MLTKQTIETMRKQWNTEAPARVETTNAICDAALCWVHAAETNMVRDGDDGVRLVASEVLSGG